MIQRKIRDLMLREGLKTMKESRFGFSNESKEDKGEKKVNKFSVLDLKQLRRYIGNKKYKYLPPYLKLLNSSYVFNSFRYFQRQNGKQSSNWIKKLSTLQNSQKSTLMIIVLAFLTFFMLKSIPKREEHINFNQLYAQQKEKNKQTENIDKVQWVREKLKSEITSKQRENRNSFDVEEEILKKLKKVQIVKLSPENTYTIYLTHFNGKVTVLNSFYGDPNQILRFLQHVQKNQPYKAEVLCRSEPYSFSRALNDTFTFIMPFVIVAGIYMLLKKANPDSLLKGLNQGKKNYKIESMKNIKIKFDDVAGMEQAKKQVTEFVDFLKNSQKYINIGAKIPKGALLTGPPGTGKTMLAKACAGEASVSFFYISGSEFVEIFVGLGASKVRELFAKARRQSPSIIFIDEIDAIGKKRETSRNEERDTTLNQLLVEMDGFSSTETVIVLAASNRKEVLDSALTRPGRFDRMVEITLPDIRARHQIFMVHLKPLKVDLSTPIQEIAKRLAELSPGFSGADIANLCNEAAIIATRKQEQFVTDKDFEEAAERVTAGYQKKSLVTAKTKRRVAHHEAGHAVAGWFLRGGDPLVKLTIIPRSKGALGYAQYLPKTSYIKTKDQLIDQVAIMLGGLTSEQIFYGNISSGGSDDLQKVYTLTRKMIAQFGMGKQTYNVTVDEQTYIRKQSLHLSNIMDKQIQEVLEEAKKRCQNILRQKKEVVESLAGELLEKETLNNEDIVRIMGPRPDFVDVS